MTKLAADLFSASHMTEESSSEQVRAHCLTAQKRKEATCRLGTCDLPQRQKSFGIPGRSCVSASSPGGVTEGSSNSTARGREVLGSIIL